MIQDFFDRLYTKVSSTRNIYLQKGLRFGVRAIANVVVPAIFKCTNSSTFSLSTPIRNEDRLIVSLTSFPARISKLHIVCESLLSQSHKPDMILVWLSKLQFSSLDVLPQKLLNLQKRGVQIRLVDNDIRSHKKYFYTLSEYPEDIMIIVDDDIIYRSTMIEDLVKYHQQYPANIIVQYGRKIERVNRKLGSYQTWKQINNRIDSDTNVFFGSGGGSLIPPHSLYMDTLNQELFLLLAPIADDVWLNAMARLQGTKIVKTTYYSSNLSLIYKKNITLASVNNASVRNLNDIQIENLSNYYGEILVW